MYASIPQAMLWYWHKRKYFPKRAFVSPVQRDQVLTFTISVDIGVQVQRAFSVWPVPPDPWAASLPDLDAKSVCVWGTQGLLSWFWSMPKYKSPSPWSTCEVTSHYDAREWVLQRASWLDMTLSIPFGQGSWKLNWEWGSYLQRGLFSKDVKSKNVSHFLREILGGYMKQIIQSRGWLWKWDWGVLELP